MTIKHEDTMTCRRDHVVWVAIKTWALKTVVVVLLKTNRKRKDTGIVRLE